MINFKLSPKPKTKQTLVEQAKEYLATLTDEELDEFISDVNKIKKEKNEQA